MSHRKPDSAPEGASSLCSRFDRWQATPEDLIGSFPVLSHCSFYFLQLSLLSKGIVGDLAKVTKASLLLLQTQQQVYFPCKISVACNFGPLLLSEMVGIKRADAILSLKQDMGTSISPTCISLSTALSCGISFLAFSRSAEAASFCPDSL